MSEQPVAYVALDLAKKNEREILAHEELCAERYGHINVAIREIKAILKWSGGSAFSIIIGLLAWSLIQQVNVNDAALKAANSRIELLQQQVSNSQRSTDPR